MSAGSSLCDTFTLPFSIEIARWKPKVVNNCLLLFVVAIYIFRVWVLIVTWTLHVLYLLLDKMSKEVQTFALYLNYVKGYSRETRRKYNLYMRLFVAYLRKKWLDKLDEIRLSHIEEYKRYLIRYKTDHVIYKCISCVRMYFRFLEMYDKKYIDYHRIENIKRPVSNGNSCRYDQRWINKICQ